METAKWNPFLRANLVLAFVQEKKRGLRNETFNTDAWNRVLKDFNTLTESNFLQGQIVNQLSSIKKMIRNGSCNKGGPLLNPDSILDDLICPRLIDNIIMNNLITDDDWATFYDEVKLTAGRPYVPLVRSPEKSSVNLKRPVDSSSAAAAAVVVNGEHSSSSSKVPSSAVSSSSTPNTTVPVASASKEVARSLFPATVSSSSSSGSSTKKAKTDDVREVPIFNVFPKKEETKMETAMKAVAKDFPDLAGEEQLMVGLALTQPSYLDLFLSMGFEGRKAFVNKFKG